MKRICTITRVIIFIFLALLSFPNTEIEGQVRLVGTSYFPGIVITTSTDKSYYFSDELFDTFIVYQNKTIKIKAKVEEEKIEFADGSTPVILSTIYEAEILEVK